MEEKEIVYTKGGVGATSEVMKKLNEMRRGAEYKSVGSMGADLETDEKVKDELKSKINFELERLGNLVNLIEKMQKSGQITENQANKTLDFINGKESLHNKLRDNPDANEELVKKLIADNDEIENHLKKFQEKKEKTRVKNNKDKEIKSEKDELKNTVKAHYKKILGVNFFDREKNGIRIIDYDKDSKKVRIVFTPAGSKESDARWISDAQMDELLTQYAEKEEKPNKKEKTKIARYERILPPQKDPSIEAREQEERFQKNFKNKLGEKLEDDFLKALESNKKKEKKSGEKSRKFKQLDIDKYDAEPKTYKKGVYANISAPEDAKEHYFKERSSRASEKKEQEKKILAEKESEIEKDISEEKELKTEIDAYVVQGKKYVEIMERGNFLLAGDKKEKETEIIKRLQNFIRSGLDRYGKNSKEEVDIIVKNVIEHLLGHQMSK